MAEQKRLLRILCVHGYRQNATTFREKSGSLRKLLKKYIDCTFVTAHHKVPPGNMGSAAWENQSTEPDTGEKTDASASQGHEVQKKAVAGDGERGWWFSREDDYFKSTDESDCDKGFPESVEQIISILEGEDGKFDGILGFSQGASLVSILCSMQQRQNKDWFKFAVLISGFQSPSSRHNYHYEDISITIPSLHVYGEGDQVVAFERSEKLSTYFENKKCLTHPGGHFIAATSAQKRTYIEFFEEMNKLCSPQS